MVTSNYNITTIPRDRITHTKRIIENEWMIPVAVKDAALITHYLLYWDRKYFALQSADGTIYKEGRLYRVIYHKCTPEDCAVDAAGQHGQIALSFRVPKHTYEGLHPVVLVSPAISSECRHQPHNGSSYHSRISRISRK